MRIQWRNLELPTRVTCNPGKISNYGEFVIEPFERGLGRTIGNSLRRVLLSCIEGCAISSVKIEGIRHEYSTIPGVLEDVTDIILNIKKIHIEVNQDEPVKLFVCREKKGVVTTNDIQSESDAVEIINKDLVLATLTEDTRFYMELEAKRGRGYVTAEENFKDPQDIGVVPVASIFSPVLHVQYHIEDKRVGEKTNYDRLIMKIKTDGSISPEMAMVEAAKILRKHLNPFIQYFELGRELQEGFPEEDSSPETDKSMQEVLEKLEQPIEVLELSVRASNCLATEGVRTIKDLVTRAEIDMLKIRNFGKTSLKEIKEKLTERGLSLGMHVEAET